MTTTFRPEIQGLRGVAALLVAVYHIWFGRVSGGVDVFFVVSGFLITHSLLNRCARDGRVRPASFLWDLYARLGPPALLVVALTSVGSVLLLPQADWPFNINEALSAAFFVNNWHLAFNAVDYLNRSSDPRPFQHFWALSVQWQFYFLWAAMFVLVHRFGTARYRDALALSMGALFIVSFCFSVYQTANNQPFAYFSTATRVWEFAAGGLLALFQPQARPATSTGVALGWTGLAAILACGALLPVSSSFPGYAALVPVVSAVLILSHGSSEHPASVRRLLSWRPFVAFGRISYLFYLWHWPLVVLWLSYTLEARASFGDGLAILGAALLLSVATHALIHATWNKSWRPLSGPVAAGLTGVTLVICLFWRAEVSEAKLLQMAVPMPPTTTHPGALAVGGEVVRYPLFPGTFRIRSEYPAANTDGCDQTTIGAEVITCVYGDAHGRLTIAAVGNSHVTHWLPALDLAGAERGWRIVLITKDDCHIHPWAAEAPDEAAQSCNEWNEKLQKVVRKLSPDFLFTIATRRQGDEEVFPSDFQEAWPHLVPEMSRIIAVRATPHFPFDVPDCVDLHGENSSKCKVSRAIALGETTFDPRAAVERAGARYLDLTQYFCGELECFPTAGNVVIYRDHDHLTPGYVRTMKDALGNELQSAMDRASPERPSSPPA